MKLGSYLTERKMRREDFAALIDVHPVTVSKWCSGAMRPGWAYLVKIEQATGGAVRAADFMPAAKAPAVQGAA